MQRVFLGLGHPRCGTGYTVQLLATRGAQVGHESYARDGIVSWMFVTTQERSGLAAPYGATRKNSDRFDVIIHNVRDPLDALPSIEREDRASATSREFRRRVIQQELGIDLRELSPIDAAAASYVLWNELIEAQKPDICYRVEDGAQDVIALLTDKGFTTQLKPLPPQNVNTRPQGKRALDWQTLSENWLARIDDMCARYGYPPLSARIGRARDQITSTDKVTFGTNVFAPLMHYLQSAGELKLNYTDAALYSIVPQSNWQSYGRELEQGRAVIAVTWENDHYFHQHLAALIRRANIAIVGTRAQLQGSTLAGKKAVYVPTFISMSCYLERKLIQAFLHNQTREATDRYREWRARPYFCAFMYRNGNEQLAGVRARIALYRALRLKTEDKPFAEQVHSLGASCRDTRFALSTQGSRQTLTRDAVELYKKYRFVIAFENSPDSDYHTEKLFLPLAAGAIPVYNGDDPSEYFSTASFLQVGAKAPVDTNALADFLISLDSDDHACREFFSEASATKALVEIFQKMFSLGE